MPKFAAPGGGGVGVTVAIAGVCAVVLLVVFLAVLAICIALRKRKRARQFLTITNESKGVQPECHYTLHDPKPVLSSGKYQSTVSMKSSELDANSTTQNVSSEDPEVNNEVKTQAPLSTLTTAVSTKPSELDANSITECCASQDPKSVDDEPTPLSTTVSTEPNLPYGCLGNKVRSSTELPIEDCEAIDIPTPLLATAINQDHSYEAKKFSESLTGSYVEVDIPTVFPAKSLAIHLLNDLTPSHSQKEGIELQQNQAYAKTATTTFPESADQLYATPRPRKR